MGWGLMGHCDGDAAAASFRGVVPVAPVLQGWIADEEIRALVLKLIAKLLFFPNKKK